MAAPKKNLRIINAYIVSAISITLVLILIGVLMLLVFNVKHLVRTARQSIQLTILVNPNINESKILLFQKQLDAQPFTNYTEYISRQQALEEMKEYIGNDIVDLLDYNPLPPVINLYLKPRYTSYDELQTITNRLLAYDIVDDVFYNKNLIYQLNDNINLASSVLGVIAFLLFIIALALINNTIRLLINSKRQEIKTMQLVGASDWFIMKPFVYNSMLQGFIAGLLAVLVLILSILFIQAHTTVPFKVYNLEITMAVVILSGILITALATFLAVKRFLWAKDSVIWS